MLVVRSKNLSKRRTKMKLSLNFVKSDIEIDIKINIDKLFDQFFTQGGTTSKKGKTFMTLEDFEITGGAEKFGVQDVEVYQIK